MLRKIHALPGLVLAVMLAITAGTGAILAVDAAQDVVVAPAAETGNISVGTLLGEVLARYPEATKISRTPAGKVRVHTMRDGMPQTMVVDPATGAALEPDTGSPVMRLLLNLHRAWLSGDGGRMFAGVLSLAMMALTLSGVLLLSRSLGGWGALLRPLRVSGARRWHLEIGRAAVLGLLLSSATGVYLSLAGFEVISDGASEQIMPESAEGDLRAAWKTVPELGALKLAELRRIEIPAPSDAPAPLAVKTDRGFLYFDAGNGALLREDAHSWLWQAHDLAYRLHTAQGMFWLALVLMLSAMAGIVLSLTGVMIWWRRRARGGSVANNAPLSQADILLLVGSEGGTTQAFAARLHRGLTAAGWPVHLAQMNAAPEQCPDVRHLLVLTATSGDGEAPTSANRFLERLAGWQVPTGMQAMVLGFGDRQFPKFCAYADRVEAALGAQGFARLLPSERIDRQSNEEFVGWGRKLAGALGRPFDLPEPEALAAGFRFELAEREEYGVEVQAPTVVLRFRPVSRHAWLPATVRRQLGLLPRFEAGDLVGIVPPGETRARYYSLASCAGSGVMEICVRHQPGGACSGFLHSLMPGDGMLAHIRPNPGFRPDASEAPLILIGAGAGIAPLIGFVRACGHRRPVHLYWGGRNPASDYLYRRELEAHALDGRLAALRTAFSRIKGGQHVQQVLALDGAQLRAQIDAGGQVLLCGGREMAEGVRAALSNVIAPLGLDLAQMRHNGRLIEDVY